MNNKVNNHNLRECGRTHTYVRPSVCQLSLGGNAILSNPI